jgi:hypothetical protein
MDRSSTTDPPIPINSRDDEEGAVTFASFLRRFPLAFFLTGLVREKRLIHLREQESFNWSRAWAYIL